MPIYEYKCASCGRVSRFFVQGFGDPENLCCQGCGGKDLKRIISGSTTTSPSRTGLLPMIPRPESPTASIRTRGTSGCTQSICCRRPVSNHRRVQVKDRKLKERSVPGHQRQRQVSPVIFHKPASSEPYGEAARRRLFAHSPLHCMSALSEGVLRDFLAPQKLNSFLVREGFFTVS